MGAAPGPIAFSPAPAAAAAAAPAPAVPVTAVPITVVPITVVPAPAGPVTAAPPRETPPVPEQLRRFSQRVEEWALANQRDAKKDGLKFWSLKCPAILVASSTGVFASVPMPHLVPLLTGLVGSICVALDGVLQPGRLRSAHLRAVHDLRTLENHIQTEWDKATLGDNGSNGAAAKILDDGEKEWNHIESYLRVADTGTQDETRGKK